MRKRFLLWGVLVVLVFVLSSCFLLQSYNLTGTWSMTMYYMGQVLTTASLAINQNGNSLSVYDSEDDITFNGTINGNNVQFSTSYSNTSISFTGTLSDSTHMSGTWTLTYSGQSESGTWNATKK